MARLQSRRVPVSGFTIGQLLAKGTGHGSNLRELKALARRASLEARARDYRLSALQASPRRWEVVNHCWDRMACGAVPEHVARNVERWHIDRVLAERRVA